LLASLREFCSKVVRHWYAVVVGVIGGVLGLASAGLPFRQRNARRGQRNAPATAEAAAGARLVALALRRGNHNPHLPAVVGEQAEVNPCVAGLVVALDVVGGQV